MKNKNHIMVFKRKGFIQSREIKSRRDESRDVVLRVPTCVFLKTNNISPFLLFFLIFAKK